ncbi:MAG: alpha/beta fold hydrolase [Pseudomonadota bacterium]
MSFRNLSTVIAATIFALLVGAAVSWTVGGQLVKPAPSKPTLPKDLPIGSFDIQSKSGSTIAGWHISAKNPKGLVLLFHGIRSSRSSMIERARMFYQHQYSVMMIDFQAHGESSGSAITVGHLERYDVIATVKHARTIEPRIPIVVLGVSMGGASALFASPLNIDAMILESVYRDIEVAVRNRVKKRLGLLYWLPSEILLSQLGPRLDIELSQLRPIDHIASIRCPLFLMGGTVDKHTTAAETREMFEAAAPPKDLWLVEGAAHVDLHQFAKQQYRDRVLSFIEKSIGNQKAMPANNALETDA